MIESKFNRKSLVGNLVLFLLAALSMGMIRPTTATGLKVSLALVAVLLLVALVVWAFRLKSLTVLNDGVEVRRTLLPTRRTYYRFAELDYFFIEPKDWYECLTLVRDGQRVLSLRSDLYANYDELCQVLSAVVRQETFGDLKGMATLSHLSWSHKGAVLVLLFLFMIGVALPVVNYLEDGYVKPASIVLGSVMIVLFGSMLAYAVYACKEIYVWRGRMEVKRLAWPFRVRCYDIDDFDMSVEVIEKASHQEEELYWLIKDGRLEVSIPQSVYSNYEGLKHAIGLVPSDTLTMGVVGTWRYKLGKTFSDI